MRIPFLRSAARLAAIGTCALIQAACSQSSAHDPMAEILAAGRPLPERPAVVGDLGGVPVTIPAAYVRLLEYDGDPNWFDPERAKWKAPERTHESKISSFGVQVHYPDMQPLTKVNFESYRRQTIYDHDWMHIGVRAASSLPPTNRSNPYGYAVPGHEAQPSYEYQQLPGQIHGLLAYKTIRYLYTGELFDDEKYNSKNYVEYFGYSDDKAITYIKCSAGPPPMLGGVRSCDHRFFLLPEMLVEIGLSYPRDLLPHWQDYEVNARRLILSFRVSPNPEAKKD